MTRAGVTKIDRLEFIGDHCPGLRIEAYQTAVAELLKTLNTARYQQVMERLMYAPRLFQRCG